MAGLGPLLGVAAGLFVGSTGEAVVNGTTEAISNLLRAEENTEALQQRVAKALAGQDRRFLFVVDDLDRLTPDEALVVLRLIKSVGRLPNVAYLLSYDREVTERVVAERYPSEGAHYLEKIVQAGFDLPEPDPVTLQNLFLEQVDGMFREDDGRHWLSQDDVHLGNMFHEAVSPELRTPRDVVRLSNSLAITWGAVRGEVHPGDFMALEALRLFRPSTYRAVRAARYLLVGAGDREERCQEAATELEERLLGGERPQDRRRLRHVLMRLFPRLQGVWSNIHYGSYGAWERERRVCADEHFDTYFAFALPDRAVGREEIATLVRRAGDRGFIHMTFREAIATALSGGGTRAARLLDALTTHADEVADADVEPLLSALFEVADELTVPQDEARGFALGSNPLRLHWLLRRLVGERMTLAERSATVLAAAERASLSWLGNLTSWVQNQHEPDAGREPSPEGEHLTTRADLERLIATLMVRIEAAAQDGSLLRVPSLSALLHQWGRYAEDDGAAARVWTDMVLTDDAALPILADAFLGATWSQGMGFSGLGDLVSHRSDQAKLKDAQRIIHLDRFKSRLEELTARGTGRENANDAMQRLLRVWDKPNDW